MFTHFIVTATSYSQHKRVAFDKVISEDEIQPDLSFIEDIRKRNIDNIPTSFHMKSVEGSSITDLIELDPYFSDVHFCRTVDEFIKYLFSDLETTSIDIGKYILSNIDCDALKLQKLTYLCYADYLSKTGKKLFKDPIFAFKHGPVCKSLYEAAKGNKGAYLRYKLLPEFDEKSQTVEECRLMRCKDGFSKIASIKETLSKFKSMNKDQLIDLTHTPGSPWDLSYIKDVNWQPISDECIQKNHSAELMHLCH